MFAGALEEVPNCHNVKEYFCIEMDIEQVTLFCHRLCCFGRLFSLSLFGHSSNLEIKCSF